MDIFFVIMLFITEILLLVFSWKILKRDIISPAIFTLIFFSLSTLCFLYNTDDWEVVFTFKAYALFVFSFLIMIGVEYCVSHIKLVLNKKKVEIKNDLKIRLYIIKPIDKLLTLLLLGSSIIYLYKVYTSGMALGATGIFSSIGYNKEEGDYDAITRLFYNIPRVAGYIYMIVIMNNILVCNEGILKNLKEILVVVCSTLITFFSGQRSAFICYLIAIFVAYAIFSYHTSPKDYKNLLSKNLMKLIGVVSMFFAIFFLSANIVKATDIEREFLDYITYYFGSTIALMGKIVENPNLCHTPFVGYFGEKTFNGFYLTLFSWNIVNYVPADRVWMSLGSSVINRAGNEYTFFCAPYIDFGFLGTLIFIFIFYLIFDVLYYWYIKNNNIMHCNYIVCSIYIWLYTLVAMSFYQDTIRSYSNPHNILYVIYIIAFCKLFLRKKIIANE